MLVLGRRQPEIRTVPPVTTTHSLVLEQDCHLLQSVDLIFISLGQRKMLSFHNIWVVREEF